MCSDEGEFLSSQNMKQAYGLGTIRLGMKIPASYPNIAEEQVTVPASVIDQIKRRHIIGPVYYYRRWNFCNSSQRIRETTWVPVTFIPFSVEATPAAARVATGNDTQISVRWKATFGAGTSSRVASREGRFVDGQGRVYGPVVRDLIQASGGSPLTFTESLRVPEVVVREFLAGRVASGIRFERLFTVDGIETVGSLRLNFAGRIASPFSVDRAELRFLDGSQFKTVPLGEEVHLVADISFSGGGRLQGSWDLAGPTTTPGAATFVRQELVEEYLSFGRRTRIGSPAIRAEQPGLYYARLSITSPVLGAAEALQLSFVVRATGEALEISLAQPPPLTRPSPPARSSRGRPSKGRGIICSSFSTCRAWREWSPRRGWS